MRDKVVALLGMLGIEVDETGYPVIDLLIGDICQQVMIYCHVNEVPIQLETSIVRNVAGEYIKQKMSLGALRIDGINLEAPVVKSITVGDTSTTYAIGEGQQTPEQKLNVLIDGLSSSGKELWKCFRKVRW